MPTTPGPIAPARTGLEVFISYSHHDRQIVPLLRELLELHHHRPWSAMTDAEIGAQFMESIDGALRDADILIAILSERSVASKWVTKEIAAFHAVKPHARIVPVLLDPVDLDTISPGLRQYQAIDFGKCLLTGFRNLFKALGNEFLSRSEIGDRRKPADDGVTHDRRSGADRRRSGTRQRMQIGFLLGYCREAQRSGLSPIPTSGMQAERLKQVLLREAEKYTYADPFNGQTLSPRSVLDRAVDGIWSVLDQEPSAEGGKIFRMLADDIHRATEVSMVDRRKGDRRSPFERQQL
jgi:hypothetical protein